MLLRMRSSAVRPGNMRATEPVERIRFFALTVDLPSLAFDFDGVDAAFGGAGELAVALDDGHLVLLHQELETLGVLVHDALLALLDGAPVQRGAAEVLDAERSRRLSRGHRLRR